MVSPVPNTAKNPPLSYADRVKKSQRNGTANTSPAQRPPAQPITSPAASPRTNGPQSAIFSPSAAAASKGSPEDSKSPERQSITSSQAEKALTPRQTNGEAHPVNVEPVAGPSSSTSKKVPAPPGVNVWDLRKVHLAAKVTPQNPLPQPTEAYQGPPTSKASAASVPLADTASPSQKSVAVTPAAKPADVQEHPPTRATEEDEDAWVVRPDRAPAAVRLPRLDATSWPEVGKASVNGINDVGDAVKEDKGKKDSQGVGSRKSEKTKWVPIPAQELQAAADAHRPSRSSTASHSRSQSQQRAQGRPQGPSQTATGAARANRASTERSKRDRVLGSTTPHSEAQSRTGSIHSSPRHASGKPRRLPDDGAGPSSLRSSRAGSPRPQVLPTAPAVESTYTMHAHAAPFYPAHIPVPGQYSAPYPPPFNPAAAPYPMYAPYPPPAPPYAFWPNPVPGQDRRQPYVVSSQSQSPTIHNSSVVNGDRSDIASSTPIDPSPAAGTIEPTAAKPDNTSAESSRGRPRVLSFGSITPNTEAQPDPEASNSAATIDASGSLGLSVADLDIGDVPEKTPRNAEQDTSLETDALTPSFTVGLAPGDPGPSKRRTQSNQVPSTSTSRTRTTSAPEAGTAAEPSNEQDTVKTSTSEPTWVFGTTKQAADEAESSAKTASKGLAAPETARGQPEGVASAIPPRLRLSPLGSVVNPEGLPPTPVPVSTSGLYAGNSPITLNDAASGDEWKVRDFGYGHGQSKEGVYYPSGPREDRGGRGKPYYGGRPAPQTYEGGGDGYRRGYGGRRGRGSTRGYGRGGRQGRGDFGGGRGGQFGRWYPRDGDFEGGEAFGYEMPGPVDTTVYYGAPPMLHGGYYAPGYDLYVPYTAPYAPPPAIPPVTSPPSAPTPAPITKLSFPLDHLRYYLLGQLEFYLSEDNLIRDIYLRQHMDSQGWVPASLLASFPRVQALTTPTGLPAEYQMEIVKDVLVLSSLVEVRGDWVRIHQWERFKLPDAAPSVVDVKVGAPEYVAPPTFNAEEYLAVNASAAADVAAAQAAEVVDNPQEGVAETAVVDAKPADAEEDEEEEEDDEDDVEIVLDKDANRSWTPERKANVA